MLRRYLRFVAVALIATQGGAQQEQWSLDRALPGSFRGQLAWDEARERMVLFGSADLWPGGPTQRSFTFEWVGERWMFRAVEEVQILDTRLCYDAVAERVVRTCGSYGSLPEQSTWEWDGSVWSLRAPNGPGPRVNHGCTFHAATGRVLVFGGSGPLQTTSYLGDTWELTGNVWSYATPTLALSPPPRFGHGMAYDSARQRSVLFGGAGSSSLRNDTWEWDGGAWQQRQPASAPPPRYLPAMAFDPVRGRIVVFGGRGAGGLRDDTWEWGGTDWQQVATATAPAPRQAAAMAFDPVAGRLMLFGGRTDFPPYTDTWVYDGTDWQRIHGPAAPSRRAGPGLVHDTARGRTVLFGGWNDDGLTWETDGRDWTGVLVSPAPASRYAHHLAFDSWRGRTVLFGGRDAGNLFGDTWEWDGAVWVRRVTSPSPAPRSDGAMAFDGGRCVTVLFGGQNFQGVFGETWEWDGATWQQRVTATVPQWTAFAMTYDYALGRIVMFGGSDLTGPRSDTWHYDGVDWTLVGAAGPAAPPPRYDPALTWHADRGRTVLFGGGLPHSPHDDLWEWDGSQWTQWNVPPGPEPQTGASMVYDARNARLLLTGGQSFGRLTDTWVLGPAGPAAATDFGTGCGAGSPPVLRSDLPFLGNAGHSLEVRAAPQRPVLLLAGLGAANVALPGGCTLLVQSPLVPALISTNAHGIARHGVPVPFSPALRGATVHFQAAVHDLSGPLAGTSWTRGLRLVVGD